MGHRPGAGKQHSEVRGPRWWPLQRVSGKRSGSLSDTEALVLRQGRGGAWRGPLGGTEGSVGKQSVSVVWMREAAMASRDRKEGDTWGDTRGGQRREGSGAGGCRRELPSQQRRSPTPLKWASVGQLCQRRQGPGAQPRAGLRGGPAQVVGRIAAPARRSPLGSGYLGGPRRGSSRLARPPRREVGTRGRAGTA